MPPRSTPAPSLSVSPLQSHLAHQSHNLFWQRPWWDFFWFKKPKNFDRLKKHHGILHHRENWDFKNVNWLKKHMKHHGDSTTSSFPKNGEKTLSLARPDWSLSSLSHKLYRSCTCKCGSNAKINARKPWNFSVTCHLSPMRCWKILRDDSANQKR